MPEEPLLDVRIEPKGNGKGRTFQAVMLASVEADLLWSGGVTDTANMRPVWAMFAGSDQELRAFMANLSLGRLGLCSKRGHYRYGKEDRVEFLKSAGYQVCWQREEEGTAATIFLPELFKLDPGMVDPQGIGFVLLPTQEWHAGQHVVTSPLAQHLVRCGYGELGPEWAEQWGATAFLFAAYLDRRTRCPLVADGRFYIQLLASCLRHRFASLAVGDGYSHQQVFGSHQALNYHETDVESVGFRPGLVFRSAHDRFEKLLAQEVEIFFRVTGGK